MTEKGARSSELCEVLEAQEAGSEAQILESAQYQCLDCLALFDSAETWLEHRRSHSRSSTHSTAETMVRIRWGTDGHHITGFIVGRATSFHNFFRKLMQTLQNESRVASTQYEKCVTAAARVVRQEYVLQADGTITPLSNTHNYVLSEQQAGEILAQVFWSFSSVKKKKKS